MVRTKKVMNAIEMERWLLSKGATPVSEEMKKKPWYGKAIALPTCFSGEEMGSKPDVLKSTPGKTLKCKT